MKLKVWLITGMILLAIITPASLYFTSQSSFCKTCHEMQDNYSSWQMSAHKEVDCVACHIEPGAVNFVTHKIQALKEVAFHFTNTYEKPINKDSNLSEKLPSITCVSCHEQPKVVTTEKLIFNHKPHIEKGLNCAACHNRVAHPEMRGYEERANMSFCVSCHNKNNGPTSCTTCHPSDFVAKPESHKQDNWAQVHGKNDVSECSSCHTDKASFCDKCHESVKPHPADWVSKHGEVAEKSDETRCKTCHEPKKDCTTCHANPFESKWDSDS